MNKVDIAATRRQEWLRAGKPNQSDVKGIQEFLDNGGTIDVVTDAGNIVGVKNEIKDCDSTEKVAQDFGFAPKPGKYEIKNPDLFGGDKLPVMTVEEAVELVRRIATQTAVWFYTTDGRKFPTMVAAIVHQRGIE